MAGLTGQHRQPCDHRNADDLAEVAERVYETRNRAGVALSDISLSADPGLAPWAVILGRVAAQSLPVTRTGITWPTASLLTLRSGSSWIPSRFASTSVESG